MTLDRQGLVSKFANSRALTFLSSSISIFYLRWIRKWEGRLVLSFYLWSRWEVKGLDKEVAGGMEG